MLSALGPQPPDGILDLARRFRADPRPGKIDLGVGVYRDAAGATPVMRAVRAAGRVLWEGETTKGYTGLAGDPAFAEALGGLVLGGAAPEDRVAAVATPGGTGAVRQALELAGRAAPGAGVWVPVPTWPNHRSILAHLGLPVRNYRYFDPATGFVDTEGMLGDLAQAAPGDVVLLHGCCHNPTGADPAPEAWARLTETLARAGATPLIDLAYQGFGDGVEADAAATRRMARELPETLIAVSCSKNFGLYRERAGLLLAVAPDAHSRDAAQGMLTHLNRQAYSFPPDHGARLVTMVLADPALRADWLAELDAMRAGIAERRAQLAGALRARTGDGRFDFLTAHRGMFSRLGAGPEAVAALRERHGIYMVGDSRMNLAGLGEAAVPRLADAILEAGI